MEFLSNIELFYTPHNLISNDVITLIGEEFLHAFKVMRYKSGDTIFITDGEGRIYKGTISQIKKDNLSCLINDVIKYQNNFQNIIFCLPRLKNPERLKFSIEKCVELGITNFILFTSDRTVSKSQNIERWNNIALSAMKQSLRSYLPKINSLEGLESIAKDDARKMVLDQTADSLLHNAGINSSVTYFIFGPEGGLSQRELNMFGKENLFRLTKNRLRSETASVFTAGYLSSILEI